MARPKHVEELHKRLVGKRHATETQRRFDAMDDQGLECGHPKDCWDTMFDCCRWCHQLAGLQERARVAEASYTAIRAQINKTAIMVMGGENRLAVGGPVGLVEIIGGSVSFEAGDTPPMIETLNVHDGANVGPEKGGDDTKAKEAVRQGDPGEADTV